MTRRYEAFLYRVWVGPHRARPSVLAAPWIMAIGLLLACGAPPCWGQAGGAQFTPQEAEAMANAAARMAAEKQKAVEEAIRQAEEGPLPGGASPDGALAPPGEGVLPAEAPPENAPRSVFSPRTDEATYTPEEMSVSIQEEPPSPASAVKRGKAAKAAKPRPKVRKKPKPAAALTKKAAAETAQPKAPPKPDIPVVPLTPVTPANP